MLLIHRNNSPASKAYLKIYWPLAFACILLIANTSCQSQSYPQQSSNLSLDRKAKSDLELFLEAGAEKTLKTSNTTASELINTAQKYLGTPHRMGGTTKKCMDCSGLLVTTFKTHGINLPHGSEEQARYGKIIYELSQLQRGDLIFFIRSYNTNKFITHSGIYLGNDEFIHASSSQGVTISSVHNSWWNERFIFGTRIF